MCQRTLWISCGLVVGCDPHSNLWGYVPGNWRYPSNEVTMSILVGIGAIALAASTQNWSLLCIHQFGTYWRHDAWWRCRCRRQNRSRRRGFLLNATSCINQSWWPPSSYGRHEAPLPAQKHTTISQHARQQVSIVKTRKNYQ
jgi:hypothetical protein